MLCGLMLFSFLWFGVRLFLTYVLCFLASLELISSVLFTYQPTYELLTIQMPSANWTEEKEQLVFFFLSYHLSGYFNVYHYHTYGFSVVLKKQLMKRKSFLSIVTLNKWFSIIPVPLLVLDMNLTY